MPFFIPFLARLFLDPLGQFFFPSGSAIYTYLLAVFIANYVSKRRCYFALDVLSNFVKKCEVIFSECQ
jgi:hypothetical protein